MEQVRKVRAASRIVATAGMVSALAVGLAACGSSSNSSSSSSGGTATAAAKGSADGLKGKNIALVACGDTNPWCKIYNKTIIDKLQAQGAKVQYLQDPFDPVLQVQHLSTAIAQKPDALLVVASDDNSIVPSLNKAKQAGIPTFNLNGRAADASQPLLTASILANQGQLGQYAAENIVEGLKKQGRKSGNIMVITGTAATNTVKDRMVEFNKVMAANPQYKVVAVEDGNWDQVLTAKLAQQIFAKYQNKGGIAAAFGMADYQAAGILQAAKQANLPVGVNTKNGLVVTGSNCFKVGIDAIKAGQQYGTATQAPAPEGEFVALMMEKYFTAGSIPKDNLAQEGRVTPDVVSKYESVCTQA